MKKHIYPNLRALMIQNNLTQKDLAKKINIGVATLQLKINKKKTFNINEIEKIIKLFNQPYEYIFFNHIVPETITNSTNSITDSECVANM